MAVKLEPGLLVRPARLADVKVATELLNVCAIADYGVKDTTEMDVQGWWQDPGFSLQQDTRLVFCEAGQLVGYMEFKNDYDHHRDFEVDVYVHPDYAGQGIGNYLFEQAEERAYDQMKAASPAQQQVELKTVFWSVDLASKEVAVAQGFKLVRHFYRMVIEMEQAPAAPVWPADITVRTILPGEADQRRVHETRNAAFQDMWDFTPVPYETFLYRMITSNESWDPGLWFIAEEDGQVAGVNLCYPTSPEDPQMGYVKSLAVRRPWRKRGLGMALLLHSFGEFYQRGIRKVGLGVDAESLTGAIRLYQRAGMRIARQADYYSKILRPGNEALASNSISRVYPLL